MLQLKHPLASVLAALLLAAAMVTPTGRLFAADAPPANVDGEEAPALKFMTVEKGGSVPEFPMFGTQIAQYRKANNVPDELKIRIGIKHYYQDGVGFKDMIAVIVPVDSSDKAEGLESTYKEYVGLIHTAEYKKGLKDGLEKEVAGNYSSNYVRVETPWRAGKVHGVRKMFHPGGVLMSEMPFEDGLENGEHKLYDTAGKVTRTATMKAGKREGPMTDFWPTNGKPRRIVPYRAGKIEGVVRDFYLEGPLKAEIPFKNDRQHGVAKEFSPDGKVIKTVYWIDGDQVSQADYEAKIKDK